MKNQEKFKWFLAGAGDLLGIFPDETYTFENSIDHYLEQARQQIALFSNGNSQLVSMSANDIRFESAKNANDFALLLTRRSIANDPAIPQDVLDRIVQSAGNQVKDTNVENPEPSIQACPLHRITDNGQLLATTC